VFVLAYNVPSLFVFKNYYDADVAPQLIGVWSPLHINRGKYSGPCDAPPRHASLLHSLHALTDLW
jgi:hypothetical protein